MGVELLTKRRCILCGRVDSHRLDGPWRLVGQQQRLCMPTLSLTGDVGPRLAHIRNAFG